MFWLKNIPVWERVLRFLFGGGLIAAGLLQPSPAWSGGLIVGGVIAILTGVFGFCPACAMVGRRLDRKA
ncbi:MAG: YgaP family membrane protein [Elstera sp.]